MPGEIARHLAPLPSLPSPLPGRPAWACVCSAGQNGCPLFLLFFRERACPFLSEESVGRLMVGEALGGGCQTGPASRDHGGTRTGASPATAVTEGVIGPPSSRAVFKRWPEASTWVLGVEPPSGPPPLLSRDPPSPFPRRLSPQVPSGWVPSASQSSPDPSAPHLVP